VLGTHGLNYEIFSGLLEWGSIIAIWEEALEGVINFNIKIDLIYCKSENIYTIKEKYSYQYPLEIIGINHGENPFDEIIQSLVLKEVKSINLIANDAHLFIKLSEKYLHTIEIVIFHDTVKYYYIKNGNFTKWTFPDAGFIVISDHPYTIQGLEEVAPNKYKCTNDGQVAIQSDYGFWLGEVI